MYPAIRRYDDEAFNDTSEETEEKLSLNDWGLFKVKEGIVEQARTMVASDSIESEVAENRLIKNIIK